MKRFISLAVVLSACGIDGALDQAHLAGACEGGDGCLDELAAGPLAAGGTVSTTVRIDTGGAGTTAIELLAADPAVLQITGYEIKGLAPGMSAVLALEPTTGTVVDFFHVFVDEPDRLELTRLGGIGAGADLDGSLDLLTGDEVTLGVLAFHGPQRLVGTAPTAWSVTGDAVTLLGDGNPDRRRLVARAPGVASVEVTSMGLSHALDITVYP